MPYTPHVWAPADVLTVARMNNLETQYDESLADSAGKGIFGDGSDGNVVTAGGGAGDVTLARDMFYVDLTVTAGDTITTAGYRIFVRGTLTNNGTISNNGTDAVNDTQGVGGAEGTIGHKTDGTGAAVGAGAGGGAGGIMLIAANILDNSGGVIECNGGAGGDAAGGAAAEGAGGNGGNVTHAFGGAGGDGGDTAADIGGTGGTATAPAAVEGGFRALPDAIHLYTRLGTRIEPGAGGASGAYDDAPDEAGGGGGGGGGFIMLIYNVFTSGTEQCLGGSGGTAFGGGGATAGSNGSAGTVIELENIL